MFTGSIVALITPMDDKGNICHTSLQKIINYHVASGTKAIVAAGTTGETSTLTNNEYHYLISQILELADGRISVIAGTGSNNTSRCISLTKKLENSGIVACLSVTPYYNCPTQEGLYHHFKTIAENTDLPQLLYNVPSRTGCDMLPETISRLSKITNIIGIKEATGDLSRVSKIKEIVKDDFLLISGDDSTFLDFIKLGGQGVISVTANIAARKMNTICELASHGKFNEAYQLNKNLISLHKTLFCEPNPIPIKWAAKQLKLIDNDMVRLPMIKLSVQGQIQLEKALINIDIDSLSN